MVCVAILLTLDAAVNAATTCEPNTLTAAWKIIVPIAVIVFDALKPGVTIGKQSINGTEELDGAELKLIAPKDADLSKVKASYGDDSVAAIQVIIYSTLLLSEVL